MLVSTNNQAGWRPTDIARSLLRNIESVLPKPVPAATWVEILPYGFFTRNYISYGASKLEGCTFCTLADGSKIVHFEDGSIIIEAQSGHLVELDRRRRVVLVRVTREEAEGAKIALGRRESNDCYESTNKNGQLLIVMPGSILIREDGQKVYITLPNKTELFANKIA